ncbi:hypothetical protein P153DRAFT_145888 [Dothidotthia symphoricarpi CBS 119687]|uniref:Uncharacterized protein n=1 Tax=Dothidotthia symphoricarpi CBS 119687 TaxID=1392245 RepID=A0A6A5ZZM0_9PLEO|nr:uncharacterized protein P153DRAFT_145888 [Dothidotthia symphoricarpi CBS 119687]KAF2123771.1 hypothetical protein P153DRAFT_145888 [Dothidotthia symphoricarpi CBS 119687]
MSTSAHAGFHCPGCHKGYVRDDSRYKKHLQTCKIYKARLEEDKQATASAAHSDDAFGGDAIRDNALGGKEDKENDSDNDGDSSSHLSQDDAISGDAVSTEQDSSTSASLFHQGITSDDDGTEDDQYELSCQPSPDITSHSKLDLVIEQPQRGMSLHGHNGVHKLTKEPRPISQSVYKPQASHSDHTTGHLPYASKELDKALTKLGSEYTALSVKNNAKRRAEGEDIGSERGSPRQSLSFSPFDAGGFRHPGPATGLDRGSRTFTQPRLVQPRFKADDTDRSSPLQPAALHGCSSSRLEHSSQHRPVKPMIPSIPNHHTTPAHHVLPSADLHQTVVSSPSQSGQEPTLLEWLVDRVDLFVGTDQLGKKLDARQWHKDDTNDHGQGA